MTSRATGTGSLGVATMAEETLSGVFAHGRRLKLLLRDGRGSGGATVVAGVLLDGDPATGLLLRVAHPQEIGLAPSGTPRGAPGVVYVPATSVLLVALDEPTTAHLPAVARPATAPHSASVSAPDTSVVSWSAVP